MLDEVSAKGFVLPLERRLGSEEELGVVVDRYWISRTDRHGKRVLTPGAKRKNKGEAPR